MNTQLTVMSDAVCNLDGKLVTTSLKVAEVFGKRHDHILRSIEKLECSENFRRPNFGETLIQVQMPKGGTRESKAYNITKDGFVFLAMGFTGKEAARFKEAYIERFNRMDVELRGSQESGTGEIDVEQARRVMKREDEERIREEIREYADILHYDFDNDVYIYVDDLAKLGGWKMSDVRKVIRDSRTYKHYAFVKDASGQYRSEERRVGKDGRSRWSPEH